MSRASTYTQCSLARAVPGGTLHQVTWLPTPFARVGKTLRLRDAHGAWQDGWVVEAAYDTLPEEQVRQLAEQYRDYGQALEG
jgi:hypothetical protein